MDWKNTRVSTASSTSRGGPSFFPGILGVASTTDLRPHLDVDHGVCSQQGHRPYQEDEYLMRPFLGGGKVAPETHLFCIFDGHAGGRASKFLSTYYADILSQDPLFESNISFALKRSYLTANEQFLKQAERLRLHDGSCGLSCVMREGKLIIANVGDCRAVMVHKNTSIQLTNDHKPTDPEEKRRIASFGGQIMYCMGVARVNGILAVSRAFGNRTIKSVIRADADIFVRDFILGDEYLVIASDGLWDVLQNKEIGDICRKFDEQGAKKISDELVNIALSRGSMDNTTACVICVKKYVEKWILSRHPRFAPSAIEADAKTSGFPQHLNNPKSQRDRKTSTIKGADNGLNFPSFQGYNHGVVSRQGQNLANDDELDAEVDSYLGYLEKASVNNKSRVDLAGRPLRVSPLTNRSPSQSPSQSPSPLQTFQKRPSTTSFMPRNGGTSALSSKSASYDKDASDMRQRIGGASNIPSRANYQQSSISYQQSQFTRPSALSGGMYLDAIETGGISANRAYSLHQKSLPPTAYSSHCREV